MPSILTNAAGERIAGRDGAPVESALLDVQTVGEMLRCSSRHIYRLADSGRMPPPVRLGSLVRWHRAAVLDWCAAGCPMVRTIKGGAR